jgi:hypothetical protein
MTNAEEIAALKAQIAELTRRFDAKDAPPAPAKIAVKPIEEDGARISYPAPLSTFAMPSSAELDQLREIVLRKFPQLAPDTRGKWAQEDAAKFPKQFAAAFRAVGMMHRSEKPDKKRYPSYFIQHGEDSLRAFGASAEIGPAFLPACLAHGDVPISDWRIDGVVLELGLNIYRIGRPATDAWKRVLATGRTIELIAPLASRNYATPVFRVDNVA